MKRPEGSRLTASECGADLDITAQRRTAELGASPDLTLLDLTLLDLTNHRRIKALDAQARQRCGTVATAGRAVRGPSRGYGYSVPIC